MYCTSTTLLLPGPSSGGSLQEIGLRIQQLARVVVIAIGPTATSSELRDVASPPTSRNYFRINAFQDLDSQKRILYDIFCQEHCLI